MRLLSVILLWCAAVFPAAASDMDFKGMGTPVPAVWWFGPVKGDVQRFRVTIGGFSAVAFREGYALSIPGQSASSPGMPDLPVVSTLVNGMAGKTVRVEMTEPQWTIIQGIRVAPAEGPVADDGTEDSGAPRMGRIPSPSFPRDEFWPVELVRVEDAYFGRSRKIRLACTLMQFNPALSCLRYTFQLEGRLVFEPEKAVSGP